MSSNGLIFKEEVKLRFSEYKETNNAVTYFLTVSKINARYE